MFITNNKGFYWLMEQRMFGELGVWENGRLTYRKFRNGEVYYRENRMDVAVGAMVADY